MVVFTCFHCGDSIQKPKVEKHIRLECKKKYLNPRLCCVDCLKDFDSKTYVQHTKCVSEEERYSGKGFVPKQSSNKGERKQSSWIEVLQTVLKKTDLSAPQRQLLKVLTNYPNVPRKQARFRKFVLSSLGHVRPYHTTIDEVFKLIDDEYKASTAANFKNDQVQKIDPVDSQQPDESEKVEKSEDVQSDDKPSKKKKKAKSELKDTDILEEPTSLAEKENLNETAAFEVVKKKKKKSKKENLENEITAMEVDKPDSTAQSNDENSNKPLKLNDDDIPPKNISKKVKKSKSHQVSENAPSEDSQVNDAAEIVSNDGPAKESKKSKSRQVPKNAPSEDSRVNDATEIVSNDVPAIESNLNEEISMKGISKKKLKKLKLLQEVQENLPCDDSQINVSQNGSNVVDSNEVSTTIASPEKIKAVDEVEPKEENLTKKERKERKKKLKYEAELKAIESEVVEVDKLNENEIDGNQKPKKKKRKISENDENSKISTKKTKVTESVTSTAEAENAESSAPKFKWEDVIRTVLEKAEGNQISLKKLTKKVVAEYQACHGEETPYEDVLKKFNKKVNKCPFAKILKDRVKLSV